MSTYVVHPNVELGTGAEIGDFVILGVAPRGRAPGATATIIGADAVIRSHTVIYAGNRIGARFQAGHGVLVRELNEIGDDVSIGSHSIVEHHVRIGDRVRVHSNAFIPEYSIIEHDGWVGPGVVFTNARYPRSAVRQEFVGPHLLPGAKVGGGATLLPGVVIGRNALVGAGAVVVGDVPDGKVVVGNPARVVNDVSALAVYEVVELTEGAGRR
jgi:acetyltransferase-like isoleucine patch superfamily enzyme